jgi:general secretion pathway protein I
MVALAVVAVALPALLMSLYQQVDGTAYLRDRSLASMVAANKLVELRLLSRARQSLLKGRDSGIEQFGEREWYWWIESTPTEIEQFYRLDGGLSVRRPARRSRGARCRRLIVRVGLPWWRC